MYDALTEFGGGVAFGSRPKAARCVGVKGMSDISSFGFKAGARAIAMLYMKSEKSARRA